ncbi:hypothetical protein FM113_11660 [Leucobacter sp. 7(1)]|uniref:pilus assembly protein n=1 Tax=Leucobacter sp. 7(1) TaxID=1255613 RepID=UPI00097F6A4C|nr:pilus assembly protein [Leucobacter sp. 7(1)]SJN11323.1 hypothetical protein FM113_11660 [Leucobacter sp. 7(1)]
MTAEFAIVLPVVIAVLGLVIGAITLAAQRIALVSLSAELARFEARGDTSEAEAILARVGEATEVARRADGALHCVELSAAPMGGLLRVITIRTESCAARTGLAA